MPMIPNPSDQPLPGAIEAAQRSSQDPPPPFDKPVPEHVYQGVGTICDWCNLTKEDAVHIPPPPNPANEPPGPPAQDPEPPKTPWFLRDEERSDYSFLRSQLAHFTNSPETYDEHTRSAIMSYLTQAAHAIARLLEADLENRKELERLTGEAQTLMNTIAREPAPDDGPPELDPAAFYRPRRDVDAGWLNTISPPPAKQRQPGQATETRRSLAPEIEIYCKDLLALSDQTLEAERRRRRELAEEFRRYIYDQARVNAKGVALIEDALK